MPAPRWSAPRPALGQRDPVHDHVRDHVHGLRAAPAQGAIIKNGHDHEHDHDHEHVHDLCAAPLTGP